MARSGISGKRSQRLLFEFVLKLLQHSMAETGFLGAMTKKITGFDSGYYIVCERIITAEVFQFVFDCLEFAQATERFTNARGSVSKFEDMRRSCE